MLYAMTEELMRQFIGKLVDDYHLPREVLENMWQKIVSSKPNETVEDIDGEEIILIHRGDTEKTCSYVFSKGERKDRACGKKCTGDLCSTHLKPQPKSESRSKLPIEPPMEIEEEIEIRCQRRGEFLVLKGTMIVLDEEVESTLGYLEPDENSFTLVQEYTQEIQEACEKYHLSCSFRPE